VGAKLALRRYFLNKYHSAGGVRVFDCCQGGGAIWGRLSKEFAFHRCWGVDVKPKKGRLKLRSERFLSQRGWNENVIDIDTYGSPWKHYAAMLPNLHQPTTVFLTIGQWQMGLDSEIPKALGISGFRVPPGVAIKLHEIATRYCVAACYDHTIEVVEAAEAPRAATAQYVGLHLRPMKNGLLEQAVPTPDSKGRTDVS